MIGCAGAKIVLLPSLRTHQRKVPSHTHGAGLQCQSQSTNSSSRHRIILRHDNQGRLRAQYIGDDKLTTSVSDGCPQIRRRTSKEEAIRCPSIPAPRPLLGGKIELPTKEMKET